MRTLFAVLFLSAFVGIAIFGVFAMNMNHLSHANCIAATIAGASCPEGNNSWALLGFHVDAFRNFSSVTFVSSVAGLFFITFVLRHGFLHSPRLPFFPQPKTRSRSFNERPLFIGERIRRWFSLHENSPGTI